MKKLYTLLVLVVLFLSFASQAQNTTCNAEFSFTIQNGNIVSFVPAMTGDAVNTHHSWKFGDGSTSTQANPVHTYSPGGSYTIVHTIEKTSSAGLVCSASFTRTIQVQGDCNPNLSFTSSMIAPRTYHFVPVATANTNINPADSIRWSFGDGSYSNDMTTNHTYNEPGRYKVCVRWQRRTASGTLTSCIGEFCDSITVANAAACNLSAHFTFYKDNTTAAPFTFHFTNTTTGLAPNDSIRWSFGDGSFSNVSNPIHNYTQAGTYNVCLRVIKRNPNGELTNCASDICTSITVSNPDVCNLVASFNSNATSTFTFHFQNTSAPLNNTDSIRWTFGDGTSSNAVNPDHTYQQPGTYNVCLRIQKRTGAGVLVNCVKEICHSVTIINPCNTIASFTWRRDSLNHKKIIFTNTTIASSAAAVVTWTFGDGSTGNGWNVVHEYASPGKYKVCIRVQSANACVSEKCDSVTVNEAEITCQQQSQFTFATTPTNSGLIHFTPSHINTTWQYTWTFGDGTGSHDIQANHEYKLPGNYNACLTVFKNANCASTTCKTVPVKSVSDCNNATVGFNYQADPSIPNKIYFVTNSTSPILMQTWTITRLNGSAPPVTIQQNNPVYLFPDTGVYRVCLRAVLSGFCIKEFCREIHIAKLGTNTGCTLQPFPNPASSVINMNVLLGQPKMMDVYIYNALNVLVKEQHQQGNAGNNLVTVKIEDLVAGNYTVKLIHGNDVCFAQFIKL